MKKRLKVSIAVAGLVALCLMLVACPQNAVKSAADGVNRYAITLSSLQDAEIKLHDAGKLGDDRHRTILNAEKLAARAGHDLDAGIAVAAKNGDPSQYINVAKQTFADLSTAIGFDPNTQASLNLAVTAASDALQNAITLINAIKVNAPPSKPSPSGMALFLLALGLFPMMAVAGGVNLSQIIQLIQIGAELEPVAFDLFVKLGQSLKGKTPEEIVAMSETIFNKVEDVAQQQLDLLDKPKS